MFHSKSKWNFYNVINRSFFAHVSAWKSLIPIPHQNWLPLPNGWTKINVDAIVRSSGTFSGITHKDSSGFLVPTQCLDCFPCPWSPTWAKVNTTLLAVSIVAKLNLNFVLFEGDAKVVIDALNSNSSTPFLYDLRFC